MVGVITMKDFKLLYYKRNKTILSLQNISTVPLPRRHTRENTCVRCESFARICLHLGFKTLELLSGFGSELQRAGKRCLWKDQRKWHPFIPEVKAVPCREYRPTGRRLLGEKDAAVAGIAGEGHEVKDKVDLWGNCRRRILKAEYTPVNKRWTKVLTRMKK